MLAIVIVEGRIANSTLGAAWCSIFATWRDKSLWGLQYNANRMPVVLQVQNTSEPKWQVWQQQWLPTARGLVSSIGMRGAGEPVLLQAACSLLHAIDRRSLESLQSRLPWRDFGLSGWGSGTKRRCCHAWPRQALHSAPHGWDQRLSRGCCARSCSFKQFTGSECGRTA